MKRLILLLSGCALLVLPEAALAQAEISARGASIRLGGRVHTQFQSSSVEETEADFFFRRARLIADVTVNDFLSGRVQTDFSGGSVALQDAFVRMAFSDAFSVSVGQFKRAFDLFELESSTEFSVIERDGRIAGLSTCPGVGRGCTYGRFVSALELGGRDQGIRVEADAGRFSFMGTWTNGTGANTRDENDEKSISGRLTFAATDRLAISGQFGRHDYLQAGDTEYANAWSVDAMYGDYQDGLLLQGAILGGDNWALPTGGGDTATFFAWQAVGSYFLPLEADRFSGWEPLLRVSGGDPDTDAADNGGMVITPGVMLYVFGRNKVGVNLDVYSPETGDTEYGFKFQTFLYF